MQTPSDTDGQIFSTSNEAAGEKKWRFTDNTSAQSKCNVSNSPRKRTAMPNLLMIDKSWSHEIAFVRQLDTQKHQPICNTFAVTLDVAVIIGLFRAWITLIGSTIHQYAQLWKRARNACSIVNGYFCQHGAVHDKLHDMANYLPLMSLLVTLKVVSWFPVLYNRRIFCTVLTLDCYYRRW